MKAVVMKFFRDLREATGEYYVVVESLPVSSSSSCHALSSSLLGCHGCDDGRRDLPKHVKDSFLIPCPDSQSAPIPLPRVAEGIRF